MQRALLSTIIGILFAVPLSTATLLLIFPAYVQAIPLAFWVIWLVISVLLTFNAPMLADWATPPKRGIHQAMEYAKWGTVLGLMNIGSGMAALLFLMSKPAS
jgi:hypothetical protein